MSDTDKYIAGPDFVERVRQAIERDNPNDPATEIWNDQAIQDLANYLEATGYAQGLDEELTDVDTLYAMYDLLKWTNDNR